MVNTSILGLGARIVRCAPVLVLAAACAVPPAEAPMIDVWYLNLTSDVVDLRTENRQPNSDGGTHGDVGPCDIGGASWTLAEAQTWSVMANGIVVLDSSEELPVPGPGEALEVVIARHPDGTHTVESAGVHALPSRRSPRSDTESCMPA